MIRRAKPRVFRWYDGWAIEFPNWATSRTSQPGYPCPVMATWEGAIFLALLWCEIFVGRSSREYEI